LNGIHSHSQSGRRILSWQLFLTIFTAAVLLLFFDLVTACSALAGGMISVLANAFFAIRLFSNAGSWQKDHIAASVYRGLIGKFLLTMVMFIMAVVLLKPLNMAVLFAAFLWIQISPAFIAGVLKA
jgi:ATP synthase protein I